MCHNRATHDLLEYSPPKPRFRRAFGARSCRIAVPVGYTPMPLTPFSSHFVARLANEVSGAVHLRAAFELLASELFSVLGARAIVFEHTDDGWISVAGSAHDLQERDWQPHLTALTSQALGMLRLDDPERGHATAISLTGPDGPPVAVALEGDWTSIRDSMSTLALVLSFAIQAVRQRDEKRRAERQLRGGYAMVRRLSRLGAIETVAQHVVDHVAQLLGADRVSLALYSNTDESLSVVATHGYPRAQVEEVRIAPGAWVIGHVYSSGRPVFVRDTRLMPDRVRPRDQYRTFAFAAVPLLAGQETIGVLTVTDKRDGSSFGRQDEMLLRGVSVAAAVSLMAARSDSEAARLAYAATTDGLTGLLNRPYLDTRLHQEVERSKRESKSLAVLMTDIDDFKRINDTRGHQVGDDVLRIVGSVIRSAVRVFDVCARYGGDEFAILMPNCDHYSAVACAERIRHRIEQYRGEDAALPSLTMSIGVAVIQAGENADDVLLRADRCLYQAKTEGKNTVRSHPVQTPIHAAADRTAESPELVVPGDEAAELRTSPLQVVEPRGVALQYVLVADTNQERAALCMEAIKPFKLGLLIARSGSQAVGLIERFGPPVLLIVDLKPPNIDGFAVIEALNAGRDGRDTDIIAWSSSRDIREYAASRLGGQKARVLSGSASPVTIRAAIERALRRHADPRPPAAPEPGSINPEDLQVIMAGISDQVRQRCRQPGVAIYLRAPGDTQFRALISWTSDELIPPSPYYIPRVFNWVQETGETVVLRDLIRNHDAPPAGVDDAVRGLMAVPITFEHQIVGTICVFDVKPLVATDADVAALSTFGTTALHHERPRVLAHAGSVPASPVAAQPAFRDRAEDRRATPTTATDQRAPMIIDFPPTLLERTGGEFAVARELARARREGRQLSVVLFDVAPAAPNEAAPSQDERLDQVAETLLKAIRQSDLPIRWSVTELLVVLPGLGASEARTVAERVRAALHAGSRYRLAISGGVAELEPDERFSTVVDRAREKVSLAVGRGSNRVI